MLPTASMVDELLTEQKTRKSPAILHELLRPDKRNEENKWIIRADDKL